MTAFAMVVSELDQVYLTLPSCAETLHRWILRKKPAGKVLEIDLEEFREWSAQHRKSRQPFCWKWVTSSISQLVEAGILEIVQKYGKRFYKVIGYLNNQGLAQVKKVYQNLKSTDSGSENKTSSVEYQTSQFRKETSQFEKKTSQKELSNTDSTEPALYIEYNKINTTNKPTHHPVVEKINQEKETIPIFNTRENFGKINQEKDIEINKQKDNNVLVDVNKSDIDQSKDFKVQNIDQNAPKLNKETMFDEDTVILLDLMEDHGIKLHPKMLELISQYNFEMIYNAFEVVRETKRDTEVRNVTGLFRDALINKWIPNDTSPTILRNLEFEKWYRKALAKYPDKIMNIPTKLLSTDFKNDKEIKINKPSIYAPYTIMSWTEACEHFPLDDDS